MLVQGLQSLLKRERESFISSIQQTFTDYFLNKAYIAKWVNQEDSYFHGKWCYVYLFIFYLATCVAC